ncbi:HEC/Ndc80p family-domain-containing protein [Filobasidium floriforme]|uniref:HEC/Ndc80p family-domain-containing protein n=1 Tax=Filobasidium floriforme TaxID=5210 RepID=UPI001E8ECCBD|nr:HEC/Ndc80p family-domain-containing protein [Filobasidium floriforme]KAH8089079.1 HEC/Ndc80p family-domain-containing protein [Filobasidium floriforme]
MDTRRRTLAQDNNISNMNPVSRLPTSTSKPQGALRSSGSNGNMRASLLGGGGAGGSQSRMSLAPGSMGLGQPQQPMMGGMGMGMDMGGNRRSTMMPGLGGSQGQAQGGRRDDLMASGGRGDAGIYGRTPGGRQSVMSASATARRSSSFASAGRQSLAPLSSTPHHASLSSSSSNNNLPDPRQIRNPTFQKQCRDQLSEYLLSSRCNLPLTSKTLISPTTKEFQSIFKWLITSPDALGYSSGYTQSLEVGAKGFEAECVQVLKDLKYPTDVGKTALGAPGSPTNWPTILVMLVWLSELAKALRQWSNPYTSTDPLIRPLSTLSTQDLQAENVGDVVSRLEKEYFTEAYAAWWAQDEEGEGVEFEGPKRMLTERFEAIEAADITSLRELSEQKEQADKELNLLKHEPNPLTEAKNKEMNLIKHKQDQLKYLDLYREKARKHQQAIEQGRQALVNVEAEIQQLEQDKAELERQVAEQNLTPDEVARMNSERSTLSESIRELSAELHKKTRELGEQEIAVTRRMDDIDSLVGKYMHGKAVIGLNASSVQQQFDIDFNVDVNMASSDLTAVNVVGQRIKESIRPGLQTFGEQLRTEWRQHSNQKIEWDDKLDRLGSELEQRRHQVQALELKLASLESAAEAEKQKLSVQTQDTRQLLAKLEADVGAMSMSSDQELLAVETEIQQLNFERQEMIHRGNATREKTQQEIMFQLEQIIRAKQYVTDKLNELTKFAQQHA